MNDLVFDRKEEQGQFKRISFKLNHYGLVQTLIKVGLLPEGFNIDCAFFDEDNTVLYVTAIRQDLMPQECDVCGAPNKNEGCKTC